MKDKNIRMYICARFLTGDRDTKRQDLNFFYFKR